MRQGSERIYEAFKVIRDFICHRVRVEASTGLRGRKTVNFSQKRGIKFVRIYAEH